MTSRQVTLRATDSTGCTVEGTYTFATVVDMGDPDAGTGNPDAGNGNPDAGADGGTGTPGSGSGCSVTRGAPSRAGLLWLAALAALVGTRMRRRRA